MNEQYLFRGKRKDNETWETGFLVITRSGCSDEKRFITDKMTGYCTPVIPETVGQCTGSKDKNGKLIFDGDLLKFTNDDGEQSVYKVFYDDVYAGWRIQEMESGGIDEMSDWEDNRKCFEVIGNIHDNEDLLPGLGG